VYIAGLSRYVVARRDNVLAEANLARQHNDLFPTFMVVKREAGTGLECDEVRAIAVFAPNRGVSDAGHAGFHERAASCLGEIADHTFLLAESFFPTRSAIALVARVESSYSTQVRIPARTGEHYARARIFGQVLQ
jgi:hypothetical protein